MKCPMKLAALSCLVALAAASPIRDFTAKVTPNAGNSSLPVVFMHGMGDSCFNSGMNSITEAVATHLGVYGVCIPTGDKRRRPGRHHQADFTVTRW